MCNHEDKIHSAVEKSALVARQQPAMEQELLQVAILPRPIRRLHEYSATSTKARGLDDGAEAEDDCRTMGPSR